MRALFVPLCLCVFSAAASAQTYSHRGFIESRGTVYPQNASNDGTHAVGESLLRYEGFFRPSNNFQISGGVDVRTDTHHQVERHFSMSWQDRETKRPLGQIRRLSATYHSGPLTFEAGKQFVRWGKTDIVTPTDRFAPRDFLTVVDNEFLPITAARLSFEKGSDTVEAVWSPRFTPSRIPLPDQRWAVPPELPAGVVLNDAGARFPGGSQFGMRWNHAGALEYELAFYQGYNHLPSFDASVHVLPETIRVDVHRFYPKMTMIGGDIAIPAPYFTIKGEAAYFASSDERTDEYGLFVLQLERQSGEWFFVGGYAGEKVTNRESRTPDFAPDRGLTNTFLGRAGYTIDTNRSVAFEAAARENGDGLWIKSEYSQAFGQHWRATASATLIRGKPADFLGQYRRNSHVGIVIRYSF